MQYWATLCYSIMATCALGQGPPSLESLAGSKVDFKGPIQLVKDAPVPAIVDPNGCPPPPKIWSGGIDFGLNGTDGNADAFNMRLFGEVKRDRADSVFMANLLYVYQTAASVVTQDMILANTRYEWLFGSSPWTYWVSGGLQYDQFRAFDVLLFAHTGLGYQWWKTDKSELKTRFGFGGSYPIGGPDESFIPEMLLGLDFEQRLSDRARFVLSGTAFPDMNQWGEWRATVQSFLEVLVIPDHNLGLRVGVVDNYISNPQGRAPNDLAYFAALAWKF